MDISLICNLYFIDKYESKIQMEYLISLLVALVSQYLSDAELRLRLTLHVDSARDSLDAVLS